MNRSIVVFVVCLASLALWAGGAGAKEFCVSTAAGLQKALNKAASNGKDDIIKVVQGTYTGNFIYYSEEGHSITLLGGYKPGCASRVVNPTHTILDGNHTGRVLELKHVGSGNIHVDGFTLRNGSTEGDGGGINASMSSPSGTAGTILLTNNIIMNNKITANGGGGGVNAVSYSNSGTAGDIRLTSNTIKGNTASHNWGGGVYADSSSSSGTAGTITLTKNTIKGNTSGGEHGGGGVAAFSHVDSGQANNVTVTNNLIMNNRTTKGAGGGVYAISYTGAGTAGNVLLTNNVIAKNAAKVNGGGVYADSYSYSGASGTVTATNNTITENSAGCGGGALFCVRVDSGHINCYNNIIWFNKATTTGGADISLCVNIDSNGYNNDYGTILVPLGGTWTHSDNNINADPLFVNPGSGNYHLPSTSPCIDKGENSAPGIPARDFDGHKRIIDGDHDTITTVDMGAYEVYH